MELTLKIDSEVLSRLNTYLASLKKDWDESHPDKKSWLSVRKTYVVDSTIFLISVLDSLIVFVQDNMQGGTDKKMAVMSVVSNVFDYIVVQAFPFWMRPFAPVIKEIVVSIIINQLVEFIVLKYKQGNWKMEAKNE